MTEELSEAARWQERRRHWIKEGIDPIIAGELAWQHLAGLEQGPETLAEAKQAVAAVNRRRVSWDERLAELED